MKTIKPTQRGKIYGEIIKGEIKTFEYDGKKFKSYIISLKEKDSGFIFRCEKVRNLSKAESSGMTRWMESVEKLVIQASGLTEGQTLKASISLYPQTGDDKETIQWTWVTTDKLEDGGLITKINATPMLTVKPEHLLEYENNSSYLNVSMIIEDIYKDDLELKLTNADAEYKPKITYVYIPREYEDVIDNYEIGEGYEFKLGFKKGAKVVIEDGEFDFGDTNKKDKYEPNKLIVKASSYLKNLKIEDVDGDDPF